MLPYPENNLSSDATGQDSSAAAQTPQPQCIALEASTEVKMKLPLPPAAATHLRKFNPSPKGNDGPISAAAGVEKRNREFAVGRHCAYAALKQIGITAEVPVDVDRKPIWPTGVTGSISHSLRYAWAAVARQDAIESIGIDTEIVVDDQTLQQVAKEIIVEDERKCLFKIHTEMNTAFTVVFSAKESIFKCLYPMNTQFFGFHDVLLVEATQETVTFAQQPSNPNYSIAPRELTVQYGIYQNDVFTTIWI